MIFSLWVSLITTAYITFKLRKNRHKIINAIINETPEKIRTSFVFSINSGMSWVSASAACYIWFFYLMFRFCFHLSRHDIHQWRLAIKRILGSIYPIYWLSFQCFNVAFYLIAYLFITEYLLPKLI